MSSVGDITAVILAVYDLGIFSTGALRRSECSCLDD